MSVPFNSIGSQAFTRTESLITVSQMKERYLFGIDLTDEKGNPIPDSVLQHQINAAVSYLEHTLDIIISETEFEEEYDYRAVDYVNFNFIQLKKRPVIEVSDFRAKFPNSQDLVVFPQDWIVVEKESGQVQLSPVEGSFSGLVITQGGSYVPLIYGTRDHWPHLFKIKYKAGFCHDKIPVLINEMVGMQAAIRTFEILGDITLGPGVTGETVSLDGASTSKQLAASAMYSVYSARIDSYRKSLKEYMSAVKKFYAGIPSVVG